jgi:hypothetical protein
MIYFDFFEQTSKCRNAISFITLIAKIFVTMLIFYTYQYKQTVGSSTLFGRYKIGLSTKEEREISLTKPELLFHFLQGGRNSARKPPKAKEKRLCPLF